MRDPIRVLSAKGLAPSSADAVARWCAANPPGYLYVGDFSTGNDPWAHTLDTSQIQELAYSIRVACYRLGTDCLIGLGIRPDVLSPRLGRNRRAPGLDTTWAVPGDNLTLADAIAAWPDEWSLPLKDNLDHGWWSEMVRQEPAAIAYALVDEERRRVEVVGALAPIHDPGYRVWVVDHLGSALDAFRADFAVVGVKGWETRDFDYLRPGHLGQSCLLQPSPWKVGTWAHGMSDLLIGLAAERPIITMRVPRDVPLERLMLGGTAADVVLGELEPGSLS